MKITSTQAPSGKAAELAAAGFADAREVGRGAVGVVYSCYQTSHQRKVALKLLAPDIDKDGRERFLREGFAMRQLRRHPNIVEIFQLGVTETNRPYLLMPYYAADSLGERLHRGGPIQWPEVAQIGVKLCGALESAHRAGALHRGIKPGNVLVNDDGEPQLADFGLAQVGGGDTATAFFTDAIAYTAPEVLAGGPPTVAADIYSLGATLYALIAGNAARSTGEELIAHYLRINSAPVPDLRPKGVPQDVCAAIETALSIDPDTRQPSAADFGRELQAAQRRTGAILDSMALGGGETDTMVGMPAIPDAPQAVLTDVSKEGAGPPAEPVVAAPARVSDRTDTSEQPEQPGATANDAPVASPPSHPTAQPMPVTGPEPSMQVQPSVVLPVALPSAEAVLSPKRRWRRPIPLVAGAAVVAVLVVLGGGYVAWSSLVSRDGGDGSVSRDGSDGTPRGTAPIAEAQAVWQPVTDARVARAAAAATQAGGTIWIFGGIGAGGVVSAGHEGYDPSIDAWKGGESLPVPLRDATSVTWRETPVVLGGSQLTGGGGIEVATDQVWRMVDGRWVELPALLQPRAAAAAAVVGDRIIVTGGVGADGTLLNTTEIFDGNSWTVGAELPTPRQRLAAASDGTLMYAVGGTNGDSDLRTVEVYNPIANTWTPVPGLPQARSGLGVAIADGRLLAVGGVSVGQLLKSVAVLDLLTLTWDGLPDMGTARHGFTLAAVGSSVWAIGGSTGVGDREVTSSAEALTLPARKAQPASQWWSLPDAPTARLMTASTVLAGKVWIAGGLRDGSALRTVESYDPATGAWQSELSLPVPVHDATAATYRGEVVVIGGAGDDLAPASGKVFVLRGGDWVEMPSLRHARAGAAAAVVGDKLIVVGGQNEDQLVPQTEVFDGESWKDGADLPTPREHLAVVADDGFVYALGGRFLSSDRNSAALERFDPESGQWTTLPEMPSPRGSFGAALIDGRIVAVGGEDPTQVLGTAEVFDIAAGRWAELPALPTPRHAAAVSTVGSTVYCIGGATRPTDVGAVATVEALNFR